MKLLAERVRVYSGSVQEWRAVINQEKTFSADGFEVDYVADPDEDRYSGSMIDDLDHSPMSFRTKRKLERDVWSAFGTSLSPG
jgi:hypothetical protein